LQLKAALKGLPEVEPFNLGEEDALVGTALTVDACSISPQCASELGHTHLDTSTYFFPIWKEVLCSRLRSGAIVRT